MVNISLGGRFLTVIVTPIPCARHVCLMSVTKEIHVNCWRTQFWSIECFFLVKLRHWRGLFEHPAGYLHWLFSIDRCLTCVDSGNFFRGEGGRGPTARKQFGQRFFLVLNLFYSLQRGSNGFITFQRVQRGSNVFQGRSTFSRGGGGCPNDNFYISIETHITCDFPGESGPPIPPI